ncbi:hypothetical protein EVAR_23466_1 [Eumeta japonica]|uniref:Uncharacterized protein n=1 Tax=Eumeta variegata TaxID=151549 RepID=A0A4C1UJU5_EUMVA|nr:hypothetical protein EVAR_23466_1 [Eumeta japonica]
MTHSSDTRKKQTMFAYGADKRDSNDRGRMRTRAPQMYCANHIWELGSTRYSGVCSLNKNKEKNRPNESARTSLFHADLARYGALRIVINDAVTTSRADRADFMWRFQEHAAKGIERPLLNLGLRRHPSRTVHPWAIRNQRWPLTRVSVHIIAGLPTLRHLFHDRHSEIIPPY